VELVLCMYVSTKRRYTQNEFFIFKFSLWLQLFYDIFLRLYYLNRSIFMLHCITSNAVASIYCTSRSLYM